MLKTMLQNTIAALGRVAGSPESASLFRDRVPHPDVTASALQRDDIKANMPMKGRQVRSSIRL